MHGWRSTIIPHTRAQKSCTPGAVVWNFCFEYFCSATSELRSLSTASNRSKSTRVEIWLAKGRQGARRIVHKILSHGIPVLKRRLPRWSRCADGAIVSKILKYYLPQIRSSLCAVQAKHSHNITRIRQPMHRIGWKFLLTFRARYDL